MESVRASRLLSFLDYMKHLRKRKVFNTGVPSGLEFNKQPLTAGQRALGDLPDSASIALGLQTRATPDMAPFTWVLETELWSSCVRDNHFPTEPSLRYQVFSDSHTNVWLAFGCSVWLISVQIESSDSEVTPGCHIQLFSWVFYNQFRMGCQMSPRGPSWTCIQPFYASRVQQCPRGSHF